MTRNTWGLLGPEFLSGARRTRTLGLASAVRYFNDRAVPGVGGIWYGKQLFLALLGVVVAERAAQQSPKFKTSKIQVANAIEALACWLALKQSDSDPRLRGREKLAGKQAKDFAFSLACKPGFYLTQPMRMQTVQPLLALGFVSAAAERFNLFSSTADGRNFVDAACNGYKPYKHDVVTHLTGWALGDHIDVESKELSDALSPLVAMPVLASQLLQERLQQGNTPDAERRRNAFAWIKIMKPGQDANALASGLIGTNHWHDIEVGAVFLALHDLAISALDAVEVGMGFECSIQDGTKKAATQLQNLKTAAQNFLDYEHTDRKDAVEFCNACVADPKTALQSLVRRDDTVLRLEGEKIKRGPAFLGKLIQASIDNLKTTGDTPVPPSLSHRFRNMYRLNLDLNSQIHEWLQARNQNDGGQNEQE
ncbi:hypothetical protein B9Z51_13190 [Limnohabitans sp. T6-5]|nr:hypothetical protein B9Z51_13190 [Limnohabitans sp. T6-5]